MKSYAYIATEGPHDVEFLAGLLKPWGFQRLKKESEVDAYWRPLIPRTFPHKAAGDEEGDLLKRVPVPTFFANATHSIALDTAVGIDRLYQRVEENLSVLGAAPAVGVVLDADAKPVVKRFADLALKLRRIGLPIPDAPNAPGRVSSSAPHCGIFVLPDNAATGTLEVLLEECAATSYPTLLAHAETYIAGIDALQLPRAELEEFHKPAGRSKATIAAMASILKPGKAIQVSLQDNQWLRGAALELSRILAVRDFLADLLQLPRPPRPATTASL